MRWILGTALVALTHVGASFLVPLEVKDQGAIGGLLRWVWPWGMGDHGPLGTLAPGVLPLPALLLALTSAGCLAAATLGVFGLWVPAGLWRGLTIAGAATGLVLMLLFFGPTKLLPIAGYIGALWVAVAGWRLFGVPA
jgi:hypothetical protein